MKCRRKKVSVYTHHDDLLPICISLGSSSLLAPNVTVINHDFLCSSNDSFCTYKVDKC